MRILACLIIAAGSLAAQSTTPAAPARPAAKQPQKSPEKLSVPKDAVESSPGVYKWTDKDGKAWTYRRTPFGVTRRSEEAAKNAAPANLTTAVDQGDSVRFERITPFGKHTWVHKKTELTAAEKTIWEKQQKGAAAGAAVAEKE